MTKGMSLYIIVSEASMYIGDVHVLLMMFQFFWL